MGIATAAQRFKSDHFTLLRCASVATKEFQ